MTLTDIFIWIGISILSSIYLTWGIRYDWHSIRVTRGVTSVDNTNAPKFFKKQEVLGKGYFWENITIWLIGLMTSVSICTVLIILIPKENIQDLKTFLQIIVMMFLICSMCNGLTSIEEINTNNIAGVDKGTFKSILNLYIKLKKRMLEAIVNDEYQLLKETLDKTISKIKKDSTSEDDKIGVLITRIDNWIISNLDDDINPQTIDKYKDLLYEVAENYLTDNEIILMDSLRRLIKEVILGELEINISELLIFLNQDDSIKVTTGKVKTQLGRQKQKIKSPKPQQIGMEQLERSLSALENMG
ncbi:MAG: hypothetical protein ACLSH8_13650 [Zhenhengia sp.]|uniref:hypothetical protein n=1 Tax=Zhenhengia sp. TaxID=2944208 RepID=UPI0039966E8C